MQTEAGKQIYNPAFVRQSGWQRIMLLSVLCYEGIGGIAGGVLLIIRPDGNLMDMPVHIMNGVFSDFLIPGIILLCLGILNMIAYVSVRRRSENDSMVAALALGGFYIWFVTEIIILKTLHWLHLMWGVPVLAGIIVLIPLFASRHGMISSKSKLLLCGMLSSAWYLLINILVPIKYKGYSVTNGTISELSAIGSPTRILWVLLVSLFPLLFAAFGWGVLQSSNDKPPLKITGWLIIAYSFFNLYWPPMHMRGVETSFTDTMHIVWAFITVLLMVAMMLFSAVALGKKFRTYTIVSIFLLLLFGFLTGRYAPAIPVNDPTPGMGIWERLNIGIFLIWVYILAANLLAILRKISPSAEDAMYILE